jgi:hypothetical protein
MNHHMLKKKLVINEIAYFGYEDVPDDAIDGGCARTDAAKAW